MVLWIDQGFHSNFTYTCSSSYKFISEKADCTITMADKDLFDLMTGKLEGQKVTMMIACISEIGQLKELAKCNFF